MLFTVPFFFCYCSTEASGPKITSAVCLLAPEQQCLFDACMHTHIALSFCSPCLILFILGDRQGTELSPGFVIQALLGLKGVCFLFLEALLAKVSIPAPSSFIWQSFLFWVISSRTSGDVVI